MKIAFALSSGYFGFFSHAGFFDAMHQLNIKPDYVGGSSSGALIASLIMAGHSPEKILKILESVSKKDFWDPDFLLVIKQIITLKGFNGFLKGQKYKNILKKYLPETFSQTKIKGLITAMNITTKKQVCFTSGNLADSVVASGIVPLMFLPYEIDNNKYIDGGMAAKVPILDLYKNFKPDIIYVNLIESSILNQPKINILNPIKLTTLYTAIARKEAYQIEKEFVEKMGCKVVEFIPNSPRISPNKMTEGNIAYNHTKNFILNNFE